MDAEGRRNAEIGFHLGFGIAMMSGDVKFGKSKFDEFEFLR